MKDYVKKKLCNTDEISFLVGQNTLSELTNFKINSFISFTVKL